MRTTTMAALMVLLLTSTPVFAALGENESGVDRLIDATGLPAQTVTATLMKLEMRRLVRALPGFRYVKR